MLYSGTNDSKVSNIRIEKVVKVYKTLYKPVFIRFVVVQETEKDQ